MRRSSINRETRETQVVVNLTIEGRGKANIETGVGFLDHLLNSFARHGLFDLTIKAKGDLEIDEHHTVEDVGIVLGKAFNEALGDKRGIKRMGWAYVPMDEALARVAVDIGGRPYAVIEAEFSTPKIGELGTDLIRHFLESFAFESRINLHAQVLYGTNDHHKAEALFKALAKALDMATQIDERIESIPSTKGVIEV